MPSLTVENYIKLIYQASLTTHPPRLVTTGELAGQLAVTPGTVTGMLKSLSEAELVIYTPYEGVSLTPEGESLALKVLRRHRLLELFLTRTLTMTWDEVHDEAEHLEHVVSDRLIERIDAYLGYPSFDPHGDPIPSADGSVQDPGGQRLSALAEGESFTVIRVLDQDPEFLRFLTGTGLGLGTHGHVVQNQVETRAMGLQLPTGPIPLSHEIATKILVAV